MKTVPDGTRIEILSRDRFAPTELSMWAERDGHTVIEIRRAGVWPMRYHRILIEK